MARMACLSLISKGEVGSQLGYWCRRQVFGGVGRYDMYTGWMRWCFELNLLRRRFRGGRRRLGVRSGLGSFRYHATRGSRYVGWHTTYSLHCHAIFLHLERDLLGLICQAAGQHSFQPGGLQQLVCCFAVCYEQLIVRDLDIVEELDDSRVKVSVSILFEVAVWGVFVIIYVPMRGCSSSYFPVLDECC
jgi:hypothetical protein